MRCAVPRSSSLFTWAHLPRLALRPPHASLEKHCSQGGRLVSCRSVHRQGCAWAWAKEF